MGLDTEIRFSVRKGGTIPALNLESDDKVVNTTGNNYTVSTYSRYYGIGYERGPWSYICVILMDLLQDESVEKVWYGNDCEDEIRECTIETVLEISRHYMENGDRPYRNAFKRS